MRVSLLFVTLRLALGQVIDLSQKLDAFPHFWKRCVGTGHMLLGTRADWQDHLRRAKNDLGFVGIRGHGLLDDDMSVMPRKGEYHFFNVDQVFDFLVKNGIKPIVELSFMPLALVDCKPDNCSYSFRNNGGYKGLNMPPKNFTEWQDLIQNLTQHLVDRYGLEEVASWDFEVWNELWGMAFPHPYLDLYSHSAAAIKSVSSKLRVGGPATMQVLHVADFVDAVQAQKLPFDFVSTHLYPTDPECPKGDVGCFTRLIHGARDYVRKHTSVPFYITEYNAGLGLKEGMDLDAPFGAAFVFRQVAAIQDVDVFSWWTFTDIFEENWMQSTPFHNGFGLQTIHGVPKPAYRAFELLKNTGTWRAPVKDAAPSSTNSSLSVLATLDAATVTHAEKLELFVADWSPAAATRYSCDTSAGSCRADPKGGYTDQALCNAQCGKIALATPAPVVTLTINHGTEGLFAGRVRATIVRIDDTHANPKSRWEDMGRPEYINAHQVANLTAASELVEESIKVDRVSESTSHVTFTLPPWSAVRIAITPARVVV